MNLQTIFSFFWNNADDDTGFVIELYCQLY